MKLSWSVIGFVLVAIFAAKSDVIGKVNFSSEKVFSNLGFLSQSKGLETKLNSEEVIEEELEKEEETQISNSFYIGALIVIIIAGYFMNKRKPLMNP
ncbi:hypothetical protein [uncultured Arcticibacterium sp.]|uniref:hypothetical protein n=1 Tax=uncultured Arcticibacterium sp. TaxID=2173042 RepID=UPI0030F524B4